MKSPDICIAGAGIIGLSLALELDRRGAAVAVMERDTALSHASTAAAGMLAVYDPAMHTALKALAGLSVALYPGFLAEIAARCSVEVPFQTSRTLQAHPGHSGTLPPQMVAQLRRGRQPFAVLEEWSLDPRQLAPALLAAVRQSSIRLVEGTAVRRVRETRGGVEIETGGGVLDAGRLVSTLGAWSAGVSVRPRKGQMLSVRLPVGLGLRQVVRTSEVYIVPRTLGPRAGTAVIGATIEDAGFDITTHNADLARLRALAGELLPELADERLCPTVDRWAGLRPATPDGLPLLGALPGAANRYEATGHYRDGILLAPATARVMAELLSGEGPSVDLAAFSPARFQE
jgi:glycine oxidase